MITIIDYGMGNLRSVQNKFRRLGVDCRISADPKEISSAKGLILPGVGHYGRAMDKLQHLELLDVLRERVLGEQTPVMGICLGMQLLTSGSEEGDAAGLGWIPGHTVRFRLQSEPERKIPHIGWNSVRAAKSHPVLDGLKTEKEMFYFVHSYHVVPENETDTLHTTVYGYEFVSAIQRDHIFGFQYHPEKSQDAGVQIFRNFINLVNAPAYV
ncbi:imidazole glycerol phosphate synthase subunit HisH [Tellurirhabdus rosea]|uniref:imidazole glycerol phosphate synthase subunit HisH n=1 Tax=Tellurirhabdus rosea TaxID=2674997 RepID=UPI0022541950|nr:imidazole glycerol phosphate synthase subunit HisH [Tellurirhabdus rosea]